MDGGSSVAALTYLHRILDSLNNPDLVRITLDYLLAVPEEAQPKHPGTPKSPSALKRRKTLDSIIKLPDAAAQPSPALFSLVDLISTSLRSEYPQTVTATLKVASVLLRRHYFNTLSTLIRAFSTASHARRTIGGHNEEVDRLLVLASVIGDLVSSDRVYEEYRLDALGSLEGHPCSTALLSRGQLNLPRSPAVVQREKNLRKPFFHSINPEDAFLKSLVQLLRSFFANSVETNLSLTDTLIAIVSCGYVTLEGWLLVDPANYSYGDRGEENGPNKTRRMVQEVSKEMSEQGEEHRVLALKHAQQKPSWSPEAVPPMMSTLHNLAEQTRKFKSDIPDFDAHLSRRKLLLRVGDQLEGLPPLSPLPRLSTQANGEDQDHVSSLQRAASASFDADQSGAGPAGLAEDVLQRKITVEPVATVMASGSPKDAAPKEVLWTEDPTTPTAGESSLATQSPPPSVTLNHLLTNTVILQEFILELAALIQVRASLFEDVAFV